MRLVSFDDGRIGAVREALGGPEVVELSDLVGGRGPWPPTAMLRFIAGFGELAHAAREALERAPGVALTEVVLEAPVPWPNKLVAFPTNYEDHIKEMRSSNRADRNGFFLKAASSLCGPGVPIELPNVAATREVHHEAELGVVLGRTGRNIRAEDAMAHVFGYMCLLDMTVRGAGERGMRKSFDTFTPSGPVLVTADEVADPSNLEIDLWVNGEPRQHANTAGLILGIPEMVELVSSVCTIYPGDVIATGTPGGVGPVGAGDEVVMEITGLDTLSMFVVQGESGRNVALDAKDEVRP